LISSRVPQTLTLMKARAIIPFPLHLTKATGAVEISEPLGQLSLVDRRLYNFLLAYAYPNLGKQRAHTVYLADIKRFAASVRDGTEEADNRRLKASVERLQQTLVKFNYLDSEKGKIWKSAQLLGPSQIEESTGKLTYRFLEEIEDRLIEPALYSYLSLRAIYQFESRYGLILYEILQRYADRDAAEPYWAVEISRLRDLLGCRDQLKNWKDFRRWALAPALNEIGRLSEFAVESFETRQGGGRGGGKVVGVTFRIRRKDRPEAENAARELDKPRVQRRGEQKIAAQDREASRALRWLEGADIATRIRWEKRAQELGVQLPPAATAPENLAKWVPAIAAHICREERLD
jgi:plasmid replication initiation protein